MPQTTSFRIAQTIVAIEALVFDDRIKLIMSDEALGALMNERARLIIRHRDQFANEQRFVRQPELIFEVKG